MRTDPSELSTYIFAGTMPSDEEAFQLEKHLYCNAIPIRVEMQDGEAHVFTFKKYLDLVTTVIELYKTGKFVLDENALKNLMQVKMGVDPNPIRRRRSKYPKFQKGAMLRLTILVIIILSLMFLYKHL